MSWLMTFFLCVLFAFNMYFVVNHEKFAVWPINLMAAALCFITAIQIVVRG